VQGKQMFEWPGIWWISHNQERKPKVGTVKEKKQDKELMDNSQEH
jgi:hypothetical protein